MLALGSSLILLVVVALLAIYLTKIDFVSRMLGGVETFWEERAIWSRRPHRRLGRPHAARRRRHRRPSAVTTEAEAARKAAEKAARWPYE